MNKNLLLIQNGFPGSSTSGTEIDTLNIRNFFKYEKNVSPTVYARKYLYTTQGSASNPGLAPFDNEYLPYNNTNDAMVRKLSFPTQWYEKDTGVIRYDNNFKHYSISFLLFAVRMKQGYLGTNVTITSRLTDESPLTLKFYDIGYTVEDFRNLNSFTKIQGSYDRYNLYPHKPLSTSIIIPSLDSCNHCFLAALFSDTAYELESGTVLLNNEPLLNISWTETEFLEAQ